MKLFCIAVLLNGCIVETQQYSHLTIQHTKIYLTTLPFQLAMPPDIL